MKKTLLSKKDTAQNTIKEGIEPFNKELFEEIFFQDRLYLKRDCEIIVQNHKVKNYENNDYTIYSSWKHGEDICNDFDELDKYLEEYHPDTTFLQYKKICKYIKKDTSNDRDYYDEQDTMSVRSSILKSDIENIFKE
mgnify:CR=1 FL=1